MGFSTDVVNECLNRKLADRMSRTYIHDRREGEQRKAFDALGRKLFELTAKAEGNVLSLLRPRTPVQASR